MMLDETIFENKSFALRANEMKQSDGSIHLIVKDSLVEVQTKDKPLSWIIPEEIEGYPIYRSEIPVLQAAYRLAASEAHKLKSKEQHFSTGDHWNTLWTRDTAYATHLGLGFWDVEACRESLKMRVDRGEIIQDTGTGGSWPISSDRIVWALGAWEVFVLTEDREWLEWCVEVLDRSCVRDEAMIMDVAGLMKGESSFLDWREQSYPAWMTPSDIGDSVSLSTMVLHSQCRLILSKMYKALDDESMAVDWMKKSDWLADSINKFFKCSESDLFGQYLYGRGYPILSPKIDVLANLLCLKDHRLAPKHKGNHMLSQLPHCDYGVPCFYPQISSNKEWYHNCATWPFVEAYYLQAASMVENEEAFMASMSCLVRGALVCGTNKENLSLQAGLPNGLVSSSDSQLWSVSGMLGTFYKGLFGLQADEHSLMLWPFVPKALEGSHRLIGLSYKNTTLDITLKGYGNQISCCLVDGKPVAPVISEHMSGHHTIEIELIQSECLCSGVNWVASDDFDLDYPKWEIDQDGLAWEPVEGADYYRVYKNGIPIAQTEMLKYKPIFNSSNAQYQVMAVSLSGKESYLNAPNEYMNHSGRTETRPCGLTGDDVWISRASFSPNALCYDVNIVYDGMYRIDAWYSNGTYDLANGNTCAIRSIYLNGQRVGAIAFPHCSAHSDWQYFNYSTSLEVPLVAGVYQVEIVKDIYDDNMNYEVNDMMLKHVRFTRI